MSHALAGDAHGGSDVGLRPPLLVTGHNLRSAVDGGAGVTVGHENLRVDVGLRQATPHSEVLPTSSRHACYQRHGRVQLVAR